MNGEKRTQKLSFRVSPTFRKEILEQAQKREESLTEFLFELIGAGWNAIVGQNKTVDPERSVTQEGEVEGQEESEEGEPDNPVSIPEEEEQRKEAPEGEVEPVEEEDKEKELQPTDHPLRRVNTVTRILEEWSEKLKRWVEV